MQEKIILLCRAISFVSADGMNYVVFKRPGQYVVSKFEYAYTCMVLHEGTLKSDIPLVLLIEFT
jgi:hypothetical protein